MIINGVRVKEAQFDIENGYISTRSYFGAVAGKTLMIWTGSSLYVGVASRVDFSWPYGDTSHCEIWIKNLERIE